MRCEENRGPKINGTHFEPYSGPEYVFHSENSKRIPKILYGIVWLVLTIAVKRFLCDHEQLLA